MAGSCTFIVASGDPVKAQSTLEAISSASRKGGTDVQIAALDRQLQSQADGEPKQLFVEKLLSLNLL